MSEINQTHVIGNIYTLAGLWLKLYCIGFDGEHIGERRAGFSGEIYTEYWLETRLRGEWPNERVVGRGDSGGDFDPFSSLFENWRANEVTLSTNTWR